MSIYLSGSFVEMCVKWRAAADDVFSVVWKMGFCVGEGRGEGGRHWERRRDHLTWQHTARSDGQQDNVTGPTCNCVPGFS